MSISIFETLENADYNLYLGKTWEAESAGIEQLHNAVVLLEKGYALDDDIDELLIKYGSAEKAPELEI